MKETFNIWNVYNAVSAYMKCFEVYHSEKNKALNLCKLGLLEFEVFKTAAQVVIDQLGIALSMMKEGNFIAVSTALASTRKDFTVNGHAMFRSCPPISLFDVIQKIKDGGLNVKEHREAFERKFRLNGPTLCEMFLPGKQGARKLSFAHFRSELQRNGYLYNNKLDLTGRELRSLYQFLVKNQIIKPLPNMVAVFEAFNAEFKLKIKSASSLQRIKDDDEEIDLWRNVFLRKLR